jgi:glutamine amidotransferase PdxT
MAQAKAQPKEIEVEAEDSETILEEAQRIVHGVKKNDYGAAHESFTRIAELWSITLDRHITPEQVALCLIQLKISRYIHGQQRDSIVDIAGYAGCLGQLYDMRPVAG